MKRRFWQTHWSLITKILAGSLLGMFCLAGIIVVTVLSFQQIEQFLFGIVDRDIANIIENAEMGRELSRVFAEKNLLLSTFLDNDKRLKAKGNELTTCLQEISTTLLEENEALQDSLHAFTQRLQALLQQCAGLNAVSQELYTVQQDIEQVLVQLDDLVVEKTISVMMEGDQEEAFAIEQLSSMLPSYRLMIAQTEIQLTQMKQASLGASPSAQAYSQTISELLQDVRVALSAVTTAGSDLNAVGQQLLEQLDRYEAQIDTFQQAAKEFQACLSTLHEAENQLLNIMRAIDADIMTATTDIRKNVGREITSSNQMIIILSSLAMLAMLGGTVVVVRMIRPIKYLAHIAERLARGDIDYDIQVAASHDEIGMLSNAFKNLMVYMQEMTSAAEKISQGNLTQNVQPRSSRDMLGQAFVDMSAYLQEMSLTANAIASGDLRQEVRAKSDEDVLGLAFQQMKFLRQSLTEIMAGTSQLRFASGELHTISEQMASATEEASQQMQMVSTNSRHISENVDAVAASAEEMSANIREIAQNTEQVTFVVNTAVQIANAANHSITELDIRSQEIGEIIKQITAITQQTNLLALNATIEAARAGEFGKGFAVVANEIKELSREIARFAEDITHKLGAIRNSSSETMEGLNNVLEFTTQIRELSSSTAAGVEEQSETTSEIAHRMVEAAKGNQDVTQVIAELATSAQQTSEGADGVQRAASDLAVLADNLQQLVSRFEI